MMTRWKMMYPLTETGNYRLKSSITCGTASYMTATSKRAFCSMPQQ